ncbi:hypothetical protein Ocin01_15233, partial [Orchesella cincta]
LLLCSFELSERVEDVSSATCAEDPLSFAFNKLKYCSGRFVITFVCYFSTFQFTSIATCNSIFWDNILCPNFSKDFAPSFLFWRKWYGLDKLSGLHYASFT